MRLIDADSLYETLCHIWDRTDSEDFEKAVFETIINAPTIESERKKGKWIRNDNGTYSCSVCQSWIPEEQHYYARYCLYCGAKMERWEE